MWFSYALFYLHFDKFTSFLLKYEDFNSIMSQAYHAQTFWMPMFVKMWLLYNIESYFLSHAYLLGEDQIIRTFNSEPQPS